MTTRCPRLWEVEAARDGRLSGDAREKFAAHLLACQACTGEAAALSALAQDLRDLSVSTHDDVLVRRLRNRVLDSVDAERVDGRRGRRSRRTMAVAVAIALASMVVAGTIASRRRSNEEPESARGVARVETIIDVVPATGTRYTRTVSEGVDRFDVEDGTLKLDVRRAPGHRVVVKTPDGEIEDVGTVFEVAVANGRTEHVRVADGRVVLRIAGVDPITIAAGDSWQRPTVRAAASVSAPVPIGAPVASGAPSRRMPTSPTKDMRPSAEDGAYLEVLRLMREGRDDEARTAAQSYLRDFPAGFRREEMRAVAEGR